MKRAVDRVREPAGATKRTRLSDAPVDTAQPDGLAQKALTSLQEVLQRMDTEGRRLAILHLPIAVRGALLAYMESGRARQASTNASSSSNTCPLPEDPVARKR